jgi:hypothetical protein
VAGSRKFYLKSIARRWKREVEAATECVVLFFPFITVKVAKHVLGGKLPLRCKVYTTFRAEHFASGASSLDALRTLIDMGIEVY